MYICDCVSDYFFGRVEIEGMQTGRITDTFAGWIENPLLFCFGVIPCGHPYPGELDYQADFDLPLPTFAGCAYGTLDVYGGNFRGADSEASYATNSSCWQKTLCYLGISVTNGSLLPSAQQ